MHLYHVDHTSVRELRHLMYLFCGATQPQPYSSLVIAGEAALCGFSLSRNVNEAGTELLQMFVKFWGEMGSFLCTISIKCGNTTVCDLVIALVHREDKKCYSS